MILLPSHPVLDCAAAGTLEAALLRKPEQEWAAMQRAGAAIAEALQHDLRTAGVRGQGGRILVVAGKGHNGGDALLAAARLARDWPELQVDAVLVSGERALRPLAARAWRELLESAPQRLARRPIDELAPRYTAILDGIFGFRYRPPLEDPARRWLVKINALEAAVRAAVDLPSGLEHPDAFQADVTYATGVVKAPLLELPNAGRIRYLDLGFFRGAEEGADRVLVPSLLRALGRLRPSRSDKRMYGHLCVVGGSRAYPGAILMSVQAAVRSGAGLVTALVPESLAPAFAAVCPEAMWKGCPETSGGGLSLDTAAELRANLERTDALLVGPGMGRETETLAFVKDLMRQTNLPMVIDADALQPDIIWSGSGPRVLTPHAGEYTRISHGAAVREFRPTRGSVTVLKGPITQVSNGDGTLYYSLNGGPVLARGGSGDMLAGIIGALVAKASAALAPLPGVTATSPPEELYVELLAAAASGVLWHGRAAELWAEARGEVAVRATELLDYLGPALAQAQN